MSSLWSETGLASYDNITFKFNRMSLQSWGLSIRTLNALLSYNFKLTIGDVIRMDEQLVTIKSLGGAGIKELISKVSSLLIEDREAETWSSAGQPAIDHNSEIPVEPPPNFLPQTIQGFPLDYLHLDIRTHKALMKVGITTIGELYNSGNTSINNIQEFHPNSLGNLNDSLIALLNSINHEDNVNWFEYWEYRHIQVLPPINAESVPSEQIIEELPAIIEDVLRRELGERSGIIIKRRYGLGNVEKLTLEDIGNAFGGLSRERIRQLEEKSLKKLQDTFIEQHYAGKNYHLHPEIHQMIQTIRDIVEAEPSKLILENKEGIS